MQINGLSIEFKSREKHCKKLNAHCAVVKNHYESCLDYDQKYYVDKYCQPIHCLSIQIITGNTDRNV